MERLICKAALAALIVALVSCGGGGGEGAIGLPAEQASSPVVDAAPAVPLAKDADTGDQAVMGLVAQQADNEGGFAALRTPGAEDLAWIEKRASSPGVVYGPRPGSITTYTYKLVNLQSPISVLPIPTDKFPESPDFPPTILNLLNSSAYAGVYYKRFNPITGNALFATASSISAYTWIMEDREVDHSGQGFWLINPFPPLDANLKYSKYLYGKPASEAAAYENLIVRFDVFNETTDVILARLNAAGAQGYCVVAPTPTDFTSNRYVLMRQRGSQDSCRYQVTFRPLFNEAKEYQNYLNRLGVDGYQIFVAVNNSWDISIKMINESIGYYYYMGEVPWFDPFLGNTTDEANALAQLNAEGAKGALPYQNRFTDSDRKIKQLYRITTNCTRWWLCPLQ